MTTKVGGVWKHKGKDGKTFLSGQINDGMSISGHIVLFPRNKKTDKEPDFDICIGQSKPGMTVKTEKVEDL